MSWGFELKNSSNGTPDPPMIIGFDRGWISQYEVDFVIALPPVAEIGRCVLKVTKEVRAYRILDEMPVPLRIAHRRPEIARVNGVHQRVVPQD